ncbi:MAG: hypothetical protein AAGA23_01010 [Pseudomonadota bacterium]
MNVRKGMRSALIGGVVGGILGAGSAAAQAPAFTWLNQFAGFPESVLRNAAPSANGFVGSTGTRSIPMRFRAPDGSIECHMLIRYENGEWSTTGDIGPTEPGGDNCGFLSGSFPVRDVTPFGTSICIGGDFTSLGPEDLNYFACYTTSGSWLQINGPGNGPNGPVYALAWDGTRVYLGGSFTFVDNAMMTPVSANRIVRTGGFSWEPLDTDNVGTSNGVNGTVTAILPDVSFVYAGVGSSVRRWSSGANDKWMDLGSSNTLNPIRDIDINATRVAATSSISTQWGGRPAGAVSEYDAGSMEWSAVGSSSGVNTGFGALAVANGFFHATGNFTDIDPDARGIARLNAAQEWEAVPDAETLGNAEFLDLFSLGGEICGVQQGTAVDQQFFSRGVACNNGTRWRGLAQGINNDVLDITRYNGAVVAGGEFTGAGDQLVGLIAEYREGAWHGLGAGLAFNGPTSQAPSVQVMAEFQGELYVMGLFNEAGGQQISGLARWDGQAWSAVGEGVNVPGSQMVVWNDQLILTGNFLSGAGPILSWDGATLTEFTDLPNTFSTPTALAVYNGDLIAAYRPGSVATIVRWNGTDWETFDQDTPTFFGEIEVLKAQGDNLYVGGSFDGQVFRFDGDTWGQLGEGLQANIFGVEDLIIADDAVVATGWFSTSGTTAVNRLAYFDGTTWYPLGAGLHDDITGSAGRTLFLDGSTVYVGGIFDQAGSVWSENIGAFTLRLETIFASGFE